MHKSSIRAAAVSIIFGACTVAAHATVVVDLGVANSFNALVFGEFRATDGDTQGPLAAGGSVDLTHWAVNSNAASNYQGYALVVGGDVSGNNGQVEGGSSYVGGAVSGSFTLGSVNGGQVPLDFASTASALTALSSRVSSASATGSFAAQWGGGYFYGTGADVEVFNLTQADFNAASWYSASGIKSGASVIVNVSGTALAMNGTVNNGMLGDNALFNFYQASTISLESIDASVLAPWAAVSGANGNLAGTLVAASFQGLGHYEFHSDPFIATSVVTAVPEPSTAALMAAGLVVTLTLSRRGRRPV